MSRPAASASRQPFYDEDVVRRLCGLSVFSRADAMQRSGHVSNVERTADALSGNVRGVWRRVDRVTVQTKRNRLQPECSRHGPAFCQHTGALLLHWLREPAAVAILDSPGPRLPRIGQSLTDFDVADLLDDILDEDMDDVTEEEFAPETAEEEIARFLEPETIATIREIARRRNVTASGTRKAEVVGAAAHGMVDPANLDAAIVGLSSTARLMLDATQIASISGETTDTRAFTVYRLLGGEGEPPLDALQSLGLVFSYDIPYVRGRIIRLPRAVVSRLPPMEGLATPARARQGQSNHASQRCLALISLITIVAQDALAGGSSPREEFVVPEYGFIPDGFVVQPSDRDRLTELLRTYNPNDRVRLIVPPAMPRADVERLALQSGQPGEVVEFAARLMIALGIAEQSSRLTVEPEMLRLLLERSAAEQLVVLANGWLAVRGWAESSLIFGDDGPIRFAWNPRHAAPHTSVALAEGIGLITRLVSRLPADVWFDAASFVETVEKLVTPGAPTLATFRQSSQQLDLTWHGQPRPGQRLALRADEGWSLFIRSIVDAVLSGPMSWLGLADVQHEQRRVTAFRARPTAAILSGKQIDPEALTVEGRVTLSDELTIVVPAGSASIAALAPILRASVLTRAGEDGLRYQVTPAGLQELFERGMNADDIARLLAEQSGAPIPIGSRALLDHWWNAYGNIRLYDELTLIELGDDLLLRELQAATSLASVTLHQFTPRLIAVEDNAVDLLVSELGARGYAPRVVEGD